MPSVKEGRRVSGVLPAGGGKPIKKIAQRGLDFHYYLDPLCVACSVQKI